MKATLASNGERVTLTENSRDLGHGKQIEVIYQDNSKGWEHEEDLIDRDQDELTYDVYFNDEIDSNNKGFEYSLVDAKGYIDSYNGTNESYFEDYKGGIVSIVCNKTGETVYEVDIK